MKNENVKESYKISEKDAKIVKIYLAQRLSEANAITFKIICKQLLIEINDNSFGWINEISDK